MILIASLAGALLARLMMPRLGLALLLAPILPALVIGFASLDPAVQASATQLDATAGDGTATLLFSGIAGVASFAIGLLLALLRAPR